MPIPASTPTAAPARTSRATPAAREPEVIEPVAGLLALAFPGAGHLYLGERWRAGAIAAGILGLFFGGLLIGGIDVIDRREDPIWFAGQALVGPLTLGVDYLHQNRFKVREPVLETLPDGRQVRRYEYRSALPNETRDPGTGQPIVAGAAGGRPPNTKSLGRMNELGTLFVTIAGMLNLIVIIDAGLHRPRPR